MINRLKRDRTSGYGPLEEVRTRTIMPPRTNRGPYYRAGHWVRGSRPLSRRWPEVEMRGVPLAAAENTGKQPGLGVLKVVGLLIPFQSRRDWLEDWRGDLAQMPSAWSRLRYRLSQLRGILGLAVAERRPGVVSQDPW